MRKEDGFVASLSWAEKGGNISSVKPSSKALQVFLSPLRETVHLERATTLDTNTKTSVKSRQSQSRWLS